MKSATTVVREPVRQHSNAYMRPVTRSRVRTSKVLPRRHFKITKGDGICVAAHCLQHPANNKIMRWDGKTGVQR